MSKPLKIIVLWTDEYKGQVTAEKMYYRICGVNTHDSEFVPATETKRRSIRLEVSLTKVDEAMTKIEQDRREYLLVIPHSFPSGKRTMRPFIVHPITGAGYAYGSMYGVLVSNRLGDARLSDVAHQIHAWARKGVSEGEQPWGPAKDPEAPLRRKQKRKDGKMRKSYDFSHLANLRGLAWDS